MCRNIKQLYNFDPPATNTEIEAAARQFVRKVTGFNKPSQTNQAAFEQAITEISEIVEQLFAQMETTATPKNREVEAAKAKARNQRRFGNG